MSLGELFLYLAVAAYGLLDPWMGGDLLDLWPLCWLKSNHPHKEILECVFEVISWSLSQVCLPKNIVFLLFYQLIVRVSQRRLLEWWIPSVHYKQNNPRGKYIAAFSFIFFIGDFRCHVSLGTQLCFENPSAILALEEA